MEEKGTDQPLDDPTLRPLPIHLTVQQVATLLNCHLSTVRCMADAGEIDVIRGHRKTRYTATSVLAWQAGKHPTVDPLQVSVATAAAMLSLSRARITALGRAGELKTTGQKNGLRIVVSSIHEWIERNTN